MEKGATFHADRMLCELQNNGNVLLSSSRQCKLWRSTPQGDFRHGGDVGTCAAVPVPTNTCVAADVDGVLVLTAFLGDF